MWASPRLAAGVAGHPQPVADIDDVADVLTAEAARTRLCDRVGAARVWLRCGQVMAGTLAGRADIEGTLSLATTDIGVLVIPEHAVVCIIGGRPGLRDEHARSDRLTSRLREAWVSARPIRLLVRDGGWLAGPVDWVAADHVVIGGSVPTAVPYAAVDAWLLGLGTPA